MRRKLVWACVLGGLMAMGLAAAPAVAATTEDVLAKLTANEGVAKTFEADTKMTAKVGTQSREMTGHMIVQGVMKDGKRAGSLMNYKQTMKMGDMVTTTLMVNDGEFMWMETQMPQGVMVMKNKIDPAKQQTGDTSTLRDMYDLKLVGEEEFDGQTMWILEGTRKAKPDAAATPAAAPPTTPQPDTGKIRVNIGQKDLMTHRIRTYDKAGAEISDMQFTNIKINGTVDPAVFKYTPPEGATVMDMTKGMPDFGGMMKNMPKGMPKGMPPAAPGSGAGGE